MTRRIELPAPSPIGALPNLRDLGGWHGADNRTVATGRLYRSTDFRSVEGDAQQVLAPLRLRTIYDLRSTAETTDLPDPRMDGVHDVHLDVLADEKTAIPGNLGTMLTDPKVVQALTAQTEGAAADLMAGTYRKFVTMDSAHAAYRRFYLGLLGEDSGPALFHCTTGKDRTGWAAASFLSLMGVDRDDVYTDYLETNERLLPALAPLFDTFEKSGGDADLLRPLLGVEKQYLDAAFDELDSTYGTVATYFAQGLGIDADSQDKLRASYLVG
ncbi:MAG: tyrosine-protein phosphatase [Gordonia sp. (in: high G+C Gram-positive bacteria)]|uniref:tyrosine-protein phosphatase n=1 Tax=Gordonia sp. (in: high G+C Gram-positive bacteria) TaxID=84139 RepID=UPI003BB4C448